MLKLPLLAELPVVPATSLPKRNPPPAVVPVALATSLLKRNPLLAVRPAVLERSNALVCELMS